MTREEITYGQGNSAITKTLRYAYDADGNTVAITYPDGSVQSYIYEQGLLKSIQRPDGQTISWDDYRWYEPTQMSAPGITQSTDFDALQRITETQAKGVNSQTLMQRSYDYDVTGNIILGLSFKVLRVYPWASIVLLPIIRLSRPVFAEVGLL